MLSIVGIYYILIGVLGVSTLATTSLVRRYPPSTVTPIGPYVFTTDVPGCVNGPGGSFSFGWSFNSTQENPFCGKGWAVGTNRTISYNGTYVPNGNSKLTVYGWTRNPLISYQVLESFGTFNPASYGVKKGTTTCNGRVYDILQAQRVNQPSIDGTQTFLEFWSVRQNMWRSSNTTVQRVDMDCHFKAWSSFGMNLGSSHSYQIVAVDAYFSSGTSSFTIS